MNSAASISPFSAKSDAILWRSDIQPVFGQRLGASLPQGYRTAKLLHPVRFGNGHLQEHSCFICLDVRFINFGGEFLRHGSNLFHDGENLFASGKTFCVSDQSQSAAGQTFSVTDQTHTVMDLTFSSADQTFSSGGKPFPLQTKRIQSRTKVIRCRTKLRQDGAKLSAPQTKPFPSQIKPSSCRTEPFQRPSNNRSLYLNLLESVLVLLPVGASCQSAVSGCSVISKTHTPVSVSPFQDFHAHTSVAKNQTAKQQRPLLKYPSPGMAQTLRVSHCFGAAALPGMNFYREP